MKTLIAYYSRKGQNYVNGKIEDLIVGNTEVVARKIEKILGGKLFEINTVKKYASDYQACTEEAKKEFVAKARPTLAATVANINDYDIMYLGYPNWWGTMPMAVFTFLENCPFRGKIYPFCTHEGSGMGVSERDLVGVCAEANVRKGLAIVGSKVNDSDSAINKWISSQGEEAR